jgi:hypothetical protein
MNPKAVLEAVNHTLLLIGNTNSQITYQRQRAILSKLSPQALLFLPRETVLTDGKELFGQNPEVHQGSGRSEERSWNG